MKGLPGPTDPGGGTNTRGGKFVFFLGAGASATGEAGLPLFADLRRTIFRGVDLDSICDLTDVDASDLDLLLGQLAPEALLLLMDRGGVPVPRVLLGLFNQVNAHPNAVHAIAAFAAARHHPVWTTNYDTLIEEAAIASGEGLDVANATSDSIPRRADLVKVHGTFDVRTDPSKSWRHSSPLLYTAPPLLAGLPAAYRQRLLDDVDDSHLVVMGYAGADIDLYPALTEAISVAKSTTWFELDQPWRLSALADRFDLRPGPAASGRRVVASINPTRAFIDWVFAEIPGLRSALGDSLQARPTELVRPQLVCPPLSLQAEGRLRLAYQLGLGHMVKPEAVADAPALLRRRLATRLRGRNLRSSPRVATALTRFAQLPLPAAARDWSRRLATQQRTSDEKAPSTDHMLHWLEQRWEPHLALETTHALKYDGRTAEALALVQRSLQRARKDPDRVDVVGSLSFQLADLLAMTGDFDGARRQAHLGYGSVSSSVMALWENLTPVACDVVEGRPLSPTRLETLETTRRLFATTGVRDGVLWAGLSKGLDQKNRRDWDSAVAVFTRVREDALQRRWRGQSETPLQGVADRASLQLADIARLQERIAEAEQLLSSIGSSAGLLGIWADVVRRLARGERPSSIAIDLNQRFNMAGCPLGPAILLNAEANGPADIFINWT